MSHDHAVASQADAVLFLRSHVINHVSVPSRSSSSGEGGTFETLHGSLRSPRDVWHLEAWRIDSCNH